MEGHKRLWGRCLRFRYGLGIVLCVLTSVVADITRTSAFAPDHEPAAGGIAASIVGRVVDVHQIKHLGRYRIVVETGNVDLTVLASLTEPTFEIGDSVAVGHVSNRWDPTHSEITSDPARWTGRRADGLAYLLTCGELGLAADDNRPAVLARESILGTAVRTTQLGSHLMDGYAAARSAQRTIDLSSQRTIDLTER